MTMSTVPSKNPALGRVDLRRSGTATWPEQTGNWAIRSEKVLKCCCAKQGGRDEDGNLLAVLDGLKRRPHRDLRLAVADVAADQPVHRDGLLHVALDLVDGGELVGRLHVGERVLQLALPGRVGPNAYPGEAMRAEYSRISSAAISRTALRARPLVLAQSAPPSRCSAGASPPVYRVTSSSWSVGTYSRSAGGRAWPPRTRCTRYSRVAPAAGRAGSSRRTGRPRAARAPRSRPA